MNRRLIGLLLLALPVLALSSSLNVESLDSSWISNLKYILRKFQDPFQNCYEYATRVNLKIHEGSTITPQAEYADNNILLKLSSVLAARKVPKGPNGLVEYTNYCINVLEGYDGSNYKVVKLNVDPQLYCVDLMNEGRKPVESDGHNSTHVTETSFDSQLNEGSIFETNFDENMIAELRKELQAIKDELSSFTEQSSMKDRRIKELEVALKQADGYRQELKSCDAQLKELSNEKSKVDNELGECILDRDSLKAVEESRQSAKKAFKRRMRELSAV